MRRLIAIGLLIATALLLTQPVHGWGAEGHRIIGQIAWHYLTPEAKTGISDLLGEQSLGEAGCWADQIRNDHAYDWAKPLHFVNVPRDAEAVDTARDCLDGECVVAGLRISEALDLYPKDVDIDRGAIRVLNGKGGKSRVVGVDRGALAILERWLDVRACCGHGAARPVFCTASGERLTAGYVRRWLPVLGRRAGIAKRVHAHGLRHTHAAQLREEAVDIGIISKQLGHASISTLLVVRPRGLAEDLVVSVPKFRHRHLLQRFVPPRAQPSSKSKGESAERAH